MTDPTSGVAIVMIGHEGRIVHWNEAATDFFGHQAAATVGQQVDLIVPPEHLENHRAGLARVMAGGDPHLEGAAINTFPARFNLLRDPSGRVIGAVALFSERTGTEEPWSPIDAPTPTD